MISPTQRFIALDRNPDIEPATWPFKRAAQGIEAGTDETPKVAQPKGREPGPEGMRP